MIGIGIVGCGVIGSEIARAIDSEVVEANLVGLHDRHRDKAEALAASLKHSVSVLSLGDLVSAADLVVEAASAQAVGEVAPLVLQAGKDLMVMSVGGLLGRQDLFGLAVQHRCRIYVPSGAIAGLDAVKAAKLGEIESVTLTTSKPPAGLAGAPFVMENQIDLDEIRERTVIFEGTAQEAVKAFPANINVAASLSLAGIGPEKTRVRIIADPGSSANIHQIEVMGKFGKLTTRTENLPCPSNPKTSYLAALSAVATLKSIAEAAKIGT